jgi:hypothetical protein
MGNNTQCDVCSLEGRDAQEEGLRQYHVGTQYGAQYVVPESVVPYMVSNNMPPDDGLLLQLNRIGRGSL